MTLDDLLTELHVHQASARGSASVVVAGHGLLMAVTHAHAMDGGAVVVLYVDDDRAVLPAELPGDAS